jgi:hypothetical protein
MSQTGHIIRGTILLIVIVGVAGWLMVRAIRRSQDPAKSLFKVIVTIPTLGLAIMAIPWFGPAGPFGIVFCAIVLSVLWAPHIGEFFARPLTGLFDGGDRKPELRPAYSISQAKRKRGHYSEAVAEIWKQLARFPADFEGQLMLAEIQAENLNDLRGAEITIQRLCNQPGHAPQNIAAALNSLADWHLKYAQDPEAAKQDLEKIIELLPESEMSARAAQRIGHLASREFLLASHDRKRIAVPPGIENVGLLPSEQQPKAPEADPAKLAAEYVRHLEDHPLDTEARERLAVLYANHYGRLDLAADQLEQLISHSGLPAKRVVHWLNLLADLQVQHSAPYDAVRQTLQRVIELFPDSAAAHTASSRLAHLKLELKGKEKGQTVKLGTYEQDIGLKRGSTHQF